jgi:PAS domain S-box-containing protein
MSKSNVQKKPVVNEFEIPEDMLSPLSLAIEACKMGTWVWDVKSGMVDYSPRKMEIFGFSFNRGTLEAFTKNVYPEDLQRVWREIQVCLKERTTWVSEFRYLKDDKTIWVLESGKTSYDAEGNPVRMTGITKDITEPKLREIELRLSEKNLAEAQALTHLGSWELDLKTNKQTWSKELFKIFGYNCAEVIPSLGLIVSRVHPDDQAAVMNEISRITEDGWVNFLNDDGSYQYEFRIIMPEGKTKYIETRLKINFDEDKSPTTIHGAVLDVTATREKEQQIDSQQKLINHTSKFSALGEMAGGIAHEINNPLMIIMGKTDLLQMKLDTAEVPKELYIEEMKTVQETTDRIAKIVKGLRIFSRDGETDPYEYMDIKEIINNSLCLCNQRLKDNHVELKVSNFSNATINCRGTQISQVILNLLNNSFDAVEKLKEKWITIDLKKLDNKRLKLIITDSGKGISKDIVDRIMQPFFTTKEIGKGTGLGLSISKSIIEEHDGTLTLDGSCANTRFVVELPYLEDESS